MTTIPHRIAAVLFASTLTFAALPAAAQQTESVATSSSNTARQAERAVERSEGFPIDAPDAGLLITVDVSTNQAFLFRDGELVRKSLVGTGSDKTLRKGSKTWWFRTPRGLHKVVGRITDPVWRKPDWAFIEEGKKVPAPDSPKRLVKGKMGKYALDLGEGILIHGTDDPNSFGRKISHGCVRTPDAMLEFLFKSAPVGTPVYIYESKPASAQTIASRQGLNDLDFVAVR